MKRQPIIYPQPLQHGDKIAIVSPAGIVNPDYVHASFKVLEQQGWCPYIGKHALNRHGSFSGSVDVRLEDISQAFNDAETRAILCSRGGYGAVHLLETLSQLPIEQDPKWLIGFSDISALHALMSSKGIASIHSSMAKHLAKENGADVHSMMLFDILRGKLPEYHWNASRFNRKGTVSGRLVGGNLAVLQALIGTRFNLLTGDIILFIEDIGEPIYKVQRMMYQLRLSGVLKSLKGLIVGQFTNYQSDANYHDMETMIAEMTVDCDFPISFNAPIGHVDNNIPVIQSSFVSLSVDDCVTTMSYLSD